MKNLPADVPAAVFCVLHIHPRSKDMLPHILSKYSGVPVQQAAEGQSIAAGNVYVAPPDRHLQIDNNHIHLTHGPKEGLHRPSINVTFRSAAASYRERVIGVLLSGMLDDDRAGSQRSVISVHAPQRAARRPRKL